MRWLTALFVLVLSVTAFFLLRSVLDSSEVVSNVPSNMDKEQKNQIAIPLQSESKQENAISPSAENSNITTKEESPEQISGGAAPEKVRGVDFSSLSDNEKERIAREYKSRFTRNFNPFDSKFEVTGIVTLDYRKYQGRFKITFQEPARFADGAKYIPIFMVGITNPATNMSGAARIEDISTEGGTVTFHLVGFALMPFFSKEIGDDISAQEKDLNEVSDIMFDVNPRLRSGKSQVSSRFSFDINEKPTPIGWFDYSVKR